MGCKLKICLDCGKLKSMGRTKRRCKGCRRNRPGRYIQSSPPSKKVTREVVVTSIEKKVHKQSPYIHYSTRNYLLKNIGYSSYQEYLVSSLWKEIRLRVLEHKGRRCICCNCYGDTVHHQEYTKKVLLGVGNYLKHLVVLCHNCHTEVEIDKSDGIKRSLPSASETLRTLRYIRGPYSVTRSGIVFPLR